AVAELARRERPQALLRVLAVALDVDDVVHDVHRGRGEADGGEGEAGEAERARREELLREDERGEEQQVLDPLPRAKQAEHRAILLSGAAIAIVDAHGGRDRMEHPEAIRPEAHAVFDAMKMGKAT